MNLPKKNWTLMVAAVITALSLMPELIGTMDNQANLNIHVPNWLYILCTFAKGLGPALGLASAKGRDEHSTQAEVNQSTYVQTVNTPPPKAN